MAEKQDAARAWFCKATNKDTWIKFKRDHVHHDSLASFRNEVF